MLFHQNSSEYFPPLNNSLGPFNDDIVVDTNLTPTTGKYSFQNKNLYSHTYFASNPTTPNSIKFVNRQSAISFFTNSSQSFGIAQSTSPKTSNNIITYPRIFKDTDLRYTNTANQLLEEFIVYSPTTAINMTKIIQTANLTNIDSHSPQPDGSINFYKNKTLVASVPRPVMYELNRRQQQSFDINYSIKQNSSTQLEITKNITPQGIAWLQDPSRQYPIVIDLVIDNADTAANWVSSNSSYLTVSQETTIKTEGTGSVKLVSNPAFSTGADGACSVGVSNFNINTGSCVGRTAPDAIKYQSIVSTSVGSSSMILSVAVTGIAVNDKVMVIDLMGNGTTSAVGTYEVLTVSNVGNSTVTFGSTLANSYNGTTDKIMLQRIPQYTTVTIPTGGTLTASPFNGNTGGVIALNANSVGNSGVIYATGLGFTGGPAGAADLGGNQGQSRPGSGTTSNLRNDGGGGAGDGVVPNGSGGGFGTVGAGSSGGNSYGTSTLSRLFFGSGGGGGYNSSIVISPCAPGGLAGSSGGGIIRIFTQTLSNTGSIVNSGKDAANGNVTGGGGGGGAGGSIYISAIGTSLGTNTVTGIGGSGGKPTGLNCSNTAAGNGGDGRIYVESNAIVGSALPIATTAPTVNPNSSYETATLTKAPTNLSGYAILTFWVYSSTTGAVLNFQFGEVSSSENIFPVTINSANTWEKKTVSISSITATARDAVTKFAFATLVAGTFYIDDVQANSSPNSPTLILPLNAGTTQSHTPTLKLVTTDAESDSIQYKINLCLDASLTYGCRVFDITSSQTGWSGQDVGTSAYASGTTAAYTIPSNNPLNYSTTYYWNALAYDPAGSQSWSTASPTQSFTTDIVPTVPISCLIDQSSYPSSYRFFWTISSTNQDRFEVWRTVNGVGGSVASNLSSGTTGYVDSSISVGNTYSYAVRAGKASTPDGVIFSDFCTSPTLLPGIGSFNFSGLQLDGIRLN